MWYQLVIFIITLAGLSIGICRSKLTEPLRLKVRTKSAWWGTFVGCVMCMSLWLSVPVYLYVYKTLDYYTIGFMFAGSFTSYFLNRVSNIITIG